MEHVCVLNTLCDDTMPNGERCVNFKYIANESGIDDVKQIRRSCRFLKRKGLAEFHTALCDEDGEFAGAGYCISNDGIKYLKDFPFDRFTKEDYK